MKEHPITQEVLSQWKEEIRQEVIALNVVLHMNSGLYLKAKDVRKALNISRQAFQRLRENGTLPGYKMDNQMYYKAGDIQQYVYGKIGKKLR